MKKKTVALLGILLSLTIAACGGDAKQADKESQAGSKTVSTEEEKTSEPAKETQEPMETETNQTEAASSEEEEKIYNIGEAAQLKDWEITVASMQILPTVSADYGEFRPDEEGNQYAQIAATVSNKGKQSDKFLPSFGFGDDVSVKLLFGDGYEFSATQLLGYDKDLHDASINPLSSQEGEIFFEIPEAVINSTDELLVKFSAGNDETVVKIR